MAAVILKFTNVKFKYEDEKKPKKGGILSMLDDNSVVWTDAKGGSKVTIAGENIHKQLVSTKPGNAVTQIQTKSTEKFKFTLASDKDRDALKEMVQQVIIHNERMAVEQLDSNNNRSQNSLRNEATSQLSAAELKRAKKNEHDDNLCAYALTQNPQLKQMYVYLTQTKKSLTHEEFWQGHKAELDKFRKVDDEEVNPNIGVASNVISTFKQQQSRSNDKVKYNINTDSKRQIFNLYPQLQEQYVTMVPVQITDRQFWERVVQSEMFHRGSKVNSDAPSVTELFPGLRQEKGVSSSTTGIATPASWMPNLKRKRTAFDPRYDLDATEEKPNSDDETGQEEEKRGRGQIVRAKAAKAAKLSLINQDSASILSTMKVEPIEITGSNHNSILAQSTDLEDLHFQEEVAPTPLAFDPMVLQAQPSTTTTTTTTTSNSTASDIDLTHPIVTTLDPSELNVGGTDYVERISKKYLTPKVNVTIDHTAAEEVVLYDEAISGVLRHYWNCFSPTIKVARVKASTPLGKKAVRMAAALQQTLDEKLPHLIAQALGESNKHLIENLTLRVDTALAHYESWQETLKKMAKMMSKKKK